MIPATAVALHALAPETASGSAASVDVGTATTLRLTLAVSAISGSSAQITARVETSPDGMSWRTVMTFTPIGSIGTQYRVAAPVDRYVRASWTLQGGGPSVTFSLSGFALRPYANLGHLAALTNVGRAFADIAPETLESALSKACSRADNLLEDARYVLPLLVWPDSLTDDVLAIAIWQLFSEVVGFNPEDAADSVIRTRYEDAMKALARGSYSGIVDSTPTLDEGEAYVVSAAPRRWV